VCDIFKKKKKKKRVVLFRLQEHQHAHFDLENPQKSLNQTSQKERNGDFDCQIAATRALVYINTYSGGTISFPV
jgi:hypothetical protein